MNAEESRPRPACWKESAITPYTHGPTVHDDGTTTFSLWAPNAESVTLVVRDQATDMSAADRGWFTARVEAGHGDRYGFRLDGGDVLPDPASRRQPEGVHERSALVDPRQFSWSREEFRWRPPPAATAVIYELHVGTFTPGGTFESALPRLERIRQLGVTHVEVMPVNVFNGPRGWGYDGVDWYAVHEPYGGPVWFADFVDACHRADLGVLLDVVYNHLGPTGNYLSEFGPYLTDRYDTPWGQALNLDGPGSDEVREFIVGNALMWLDQYHVDGLRLDAVHGLIDTSSVHLLAELSERVDDLVGRVGRPLLLIAESDRQDPQTVRPRAVGGLGLDAQWLDDLHHGIHVAVTGERDGYYADYTGLADVAHAYASGFVYGGRYSPSRQRTVGAPLDPAISSRTLVACVQNHDQVGNRARGDRLTTLVEPPLQRAAIALLCLSPTTPLLFMGEEHAETHPFCYFTSHPEPELAEAVRTGRREEFADFTSFDGTVPDPQDAATFRASVLDWSRADTDEGTARRALWADLLALRRQLPALATGRRDLVEVLHVDEERMAVLRRHPTAAPVLIVANLSRDAAELGVTGSEWVPHWSSEDVGYGGDGASATVLDDRSAVNVPARSVWLFTTP